MTSNRPIPRWSSQTVAATRLRARGGMDSTVANSGFEIRLWREASAARAAETSVDLQRVVVHVRRAHRVGVGLRQRVCERPLAADFREVEQALIFEAVDHRGVRGGAEGTGLLEVR